MTENIVSANEKYAYHIGKDYACANNEVQAMLLTGMFEQLTYVCQSNLENQLCYIWTSLGDEAKKNIVKLAEFGSYDV